MQKLYLAHTGTPHEGNIPHSGRYEWGSGENPHQHRFDFLTEVKNMRASGQYKNDTEIAKALNMSTGEFRSKLSVLDKELYSYNAGRAYHMRYDKKMSTQAIADALGVSEATVRNYLKNPEKKKDQILESTTNILREAVDKKGYIDVGEGVEISLGISQTKKQAALEKLKMEGYVVKPIQVEQINSPEHTKTTVLVLAKEGTTGKDIYEHMDDISLVKEYHSDDFGSTYTGLEQPVSVDSKRIQINYGDGNGYQPKEGVIELRPGVADISLGDSKYAQVRIAVDDKYYMKGMAIYANDLPDGVDIRFNTKKDPGTPMEKVLKPLKTVNGEKDGDIDWDNPFGAAIKAGGQRHYIDENGEKRLSAINKVNEEGDWGEWDKTLASQFLSKQDLNLAKKQLNITYLNKLDEFEEIKSLTNPEVKKRLLESFADDCDASAVNLKAASLPRQATQVLLPLESIKETEIYAPNFKDGERVCLVRYPHSGPSEIPDLIVNNKNKEARSIFGTNAKDCVVINPKVAEKLSGADFDGDSVVVMPNKGGRTINTANSLVNGFDPHIQYAGYEGMKVMKESYKGKEMGVAANLITDMYIKGADSSELARAIKYSMVVVDAPKHELDYQRAYKELHIQELKDRYQDGGGASTIISQAKAEYRVPQRKLYSKIDPDTGEKIYFETGGSYTQKKILKSGEVKTKEIKRTTKSTRMAETKDAFSLTSDPSNPYPMEEAYAIFANRMKALGNQARKEMVHTPSTIFDKGASKVYSNEVESLDTKLKIAKSNAPYERKAQMIANVKMKALKEENPNMTNEEKKKKAQQALNGARARVIPGGKKTRVDISDKEWEAIQAGAISSTKLKEILNNADLDKVKELATPRETKGLTDSKIARAKAMLNSGYYTQADVAELFGVSPTTLMRYLKA